LINPVYKTQTRAKAQTYRVEPYVIAADVYSEGTNAGRGGWTWYTGSAGWIFKATVENLLGIQRRGNSLIVRPRIPSNWPGYKATLQLDVTTVHVAVDNSASPVSAPRATLNGQEIATAEDGSVTFSLGGEQQRLELILGSNVRRQDEDNQAAMTLLDAG
jgi:cyclic beta-1,2-glucan synthetase